jgi:hypothetical protein
MADRWPSLQQEHTPARLAFPACLRSVHTSKRKILELLVVALSLLLLLLLLLATSFSHHKDGPTKQLTLKGFAT